MLKRLQANKSNTADMLQNIINCKLSARDGQRPHITGNGQREQIYNKRWLGTSDVIQ